MALSLQATVTYLCSTPYALASEHGIHPLDAELAIRPDDVISLLSPKDAAAPTLAQAREAGLLPSFEQCRRWYDR
jgi:dTDP-4-dehydrorhamnose 3,5-epimerase